MLISVTEPTDAAEARRRAAFQADEIDLGERQQGALAIVVTEMATNLVKHAGNGTIDIESLSQNGSRGIRVLGLDRGPGIRDVSAALQDGYSSAGTPGNGLGAIKRLSQSFDIYSGPGLGTAVLAEFWAHNKVAGSPYPIEIGVVSTPIRGEQVCGDGWAAKRLPDSVLLMVVDGLGHGVLAADAAKEAESVFSASRSNSPAAILRDGHDALKKTRGAAMAIAALNFERRLVTFSGVGNISASIVTPAGSRGLASHNGTLGHHLGNVQEFTFPWTLDSFLVMHSDGLKTNWDLSRYPGIWMKHPALIAGVLSRDFSRERDDLTVLVAKNFHGTGQ